MTKLKWASALSAGAFLMGATFAQAQQYNPGTRAQSNTRVQRTQGNPGLQADPRYSTEGATPAYAPQTYPTQRNTAQSSQARRGQQAGAMDLEIAAHLAMKNAGEVQLARFAQDQTENDEVREFAQTMVKDHSGFLNQLRRVQPQVVAAYGQVSTRTASSDDESYDSRGTRRSGADDSEFDSGGNDPSERGDRSRRSDRTRAGSSDDEGNFSTDRSRTDRSDRANTDRSGSERSGAGRIGNSSDRPASGQDSTGDSSDSFNNRSGSTGSQSGTSGTRNGASGARGNTGTGGVRSGVGSNNSGGGAGSPGTSGAGGAGTGGTGTSGSSGAGGTSGAGGSSGSGGGAGAGGGSGGSGGGGAGGAGSFIVPKMKSYPVVFQAGSRDENEDSEVPNASTSGADEDEGTTISGRSRSNSSTRANDDRESDDSDDSEARSSRSARSDDSADEGYRSRSSDRDALRSRGYDDAGDARPTQRTSGNQPRYADDYDTRRPSTTQQTQATQSSGGHTAHLQLHHEIAQQCVAATQRELESKSEDEFDKCYVGGQVTAHIQMLATLKAVRRHASPNLAQIIDEGIDTTEQHLEHAKELLESLENDDSRTSRRSNSTSR